MQEQSQEEGISYADSVYFHQSQKVNVDESPPLQSQSQLNLSSTMKMDNKKSSKFQSLNYSESRKIEKVSDKVLWVQFEDLVVDLNQRSAHEKGGLSILHDRSQNQIEMLELKCKETEKQAIQLGQAFNTLKNLPHQFEEEYQNFSREAPKIDDDSLRKSAFKLMQTSDYSQKPWQEAINEIRIFERRLLDTSSSYKQQIELITEKGISQIDELEQEIQEHLAKQRSNYEKIKQEITDLQENLNRMLEEENQKNQQQMKRLMNSLQLGLDSLLLMLGMQ